MEYGPDELMYLFAIIAVVAFVFLALREIFTWYWKIDTRIRLQQESLKELKKISALLEKAHGPLPEPVKDFVPHGKADKKTEEKPEEKTSGVAADFERRRKGAW